jgi:hypothetical protein
MTEPSRHDRMVEAAKYLAKQGFAQIGWGSSVDGKAVNRKWKDDATDDPALVAPLLAGNRNSLVIPKAGAVIIDADDAEVRDAIANLMRAGLAVDTPTEGHRHFYVWADDATVFPDTFDGGEVRRVGTSGRPGMVLGPWSLTDAGVYTPVGASRVIPIATRDVLDYVLARTATKKTNGADGGVHIVVEGEWQYVESMGSRHDLIRNAIRHWRGLDVTGDALRTLTRDFIAKHGIPLERNGRVIDEAEIERLCVGAEANFSADEPGTGTAPPPPLVGTVVGGPDPGPEPVGIGWRFTARTADGNDLTLTVAPAMSGITLVEATYADRVLARNSHESLASIRFRNTLADELASLSGWRRGTTSPWYWLLDRAIAQLNLHDAITAVQFDTATAERAEDDHPLDRLDPFIRAGLNASLIALPGRGKTRLVIATDLTLASAEPVVPGILPPDPEPISTVQFNWENPVDLLQREAMRLARGANLVGDFPLHFVAMTGPITSRVEEMARIVDRHDAQHMDIDSFQAAIGSSGAAAGGGDIWGAAAEGVLDVIDAIRRLTGRVDLSALLIDHARGNAGASKVDKWEKRHELVAYGSTRKAARLRASFGMMVTDRAVIDSGRFGVRMTSMTVGIINIKPWPDREPAPDLFLDFVFSSGLGVKPKVIVQTGAAPAAAPGSASASAPASGLTADILDQIKASGPMTVKEIAAALGKTNDTVRKAMNRRPDLFTEQDGQRSLRLDGVEEDAAEASYDLS